MTRKKLLLLFFIFGFSLSIFAQEAITFVKEGQKAPDFSIKMQNGKTLKLSDLKGKVVWINFFADWCPPCRVELPHLEKEVFEKFKGKGLEVMVIGREHDWATVDKFKKANNYKMNFYPDPEREIFSKYAAQSIPRNFLIDKNGTIVVSSIGFKESEFRKIIEKAEELIK